ncbi:MAG: ATP-binding cassette domain-containing protein, partial [Promethearchaeota archaeon]
MAEEITIRLEDVWKTYIIGTEEVNALQGVSLDIPQGEFHVIMGPSGSGKTTFLNMV